MLKKSEIISSMVEQLQKELEVLSLAAQGAYEAATHEESKAEDSHDTRGLEASYLAGAQRARIENLKMVIHSFQTAEIRDFLSQDAIEIGSLVQLTSDGKVSYHLLMPSGGGVKVNVKGQTIQVVTPQSPLGEALLGKKVGDLIEIETPRGDRKYLIHSLI